MKALYHDMITITVCDTSHTSLIESPGPGNGISEDGEYSQRPEDLWDKRLGLRASDHGMTGCLREY